MRRITLSALAAALVLVPATSAWASSGKPSQQPVRTYQNACALCHDRGGFGVRVLADRLGPEAALLHQRHDLDADFVRAAVRHGIGAMPPMSKGEVSDAVLGGIVNELTQHKRRPGR